MNPTPPENSSESPPIRRHGVVAVAWQAGRLLVIQRSAQVVAPGAYCFPGGGIDGDETEPVALIREIQEELGLTIVPIRRVWQSVTPWHVALAWWLVRLPEGATPVPNPAEVARCDWLTPDEMRRLPGLLESNLAFLNALAAGEICLAASDA
jgi:8-oxo-dGTP diphosphatase